jgi:hypothetical protein
LKRLVLKYTSFWLKFKPYNGLKTTTKIISIKRMVGTSFIIL